MRLKNLDNTSALYNALSHGQPGSRHFGMLGIVYLRTLYLAASVKLEQHVCVAGATEAICCRLLHQGHAIADALAPQESQHVYLQRRNYANRVCICLLLGNDLGTRHAHNMERYESSWKLMCASQLLSVQQHIWESLTSSGMALSCLRK